jgi:hypothetical protein
MHDKQSMTTSAVGTCKPIRARVPPAAASTCIASRYTSSFPKQKVTPRSRSAPEMNAVLVTSVPLAVYICFQNIYDMHLFLVFVELSMAVCMSRTKAACRGFGRRSPGQMYPDISLLCEICMQMHRTSQESTSRQACDL